jgi:hypothetical protein
VDESR